MPDRRISPRTPTVRAAHLQFLTKPMLYACIVTDESLGGIRVYLDEGIGLPDELTIRFGNGAARPVRRCWSSGTSAGLQFIQPVPLLSCPPEGNLSPAQALACNVPAMTPTTPESWQAVGIVKLIEFAMQDFHEAGRTEEASFLSEIQTSISTKFHLDGIAIKSRAKTYH